MSHATFGKWLRRRAGWCLLILPFLAPAPVFGQAAPMVTVTVTSDFGASADYPLSKAKFNVYNSGFIRLPQYERDANIFDEVRPNALRVDLWWGWHQWKRQPVDGSATNVQYNFGELDRIAEIANAHDILPYWAYCYVPPPLQARPGDSRTFSGNAKMWGEILGAFARHAKEGSSHFKIGYHEIYNEPDNRDFFRGSRDDYFNLYREGSRAIKAADADAVIGGPALAFTAEWMKPFLEMVVQEKLPLDFFSFHFYPECWGKLGVQDVVKEMRQELAQQPQLAITEMHLNEYNAYKIDYPKGGRQDRYGLASAMLENYEWFLSQPDLTGVFWAQFQDTGGGNWSGMISRDGFRKACFYAAAIYARMPADRCEVKLDGDAKVGAMASANEYRAGVVIWNSSATNQMAKVVLKRVPFEHGKLRLFRIDAEHSSWGDNPSNEQLISRELNANTRTNMLQWNGALPAGGVVYLEVENSIGGSEPLSKPVGKLIRVLHYFPNRGTRSYADFDRRTWTARLGMATETQAHEQVGFVADELVDRLRVHVQADGPFRKMDSNSILALRLDYQVGENYTHGVLFHGPCKGIDVYNPDNGISVPWGTKRGPDRVVNVSNFGEFNFSPRDYAPANWTGRAEITFLMRNCGPETRSKFILQPIEPSPRNATVVQN